MRLNLAILIFRFFHKLKNKYDIYVYISTVHGLDISCDLPKNMFLPFGFIIYLLAFFCGILLLEDRYVIACSRMASAVEFEIRNMKKFHELAKKYGLKRQNIQRIDNDTFLQLSFYHKNFNYFTGKTKRKKGNNLC